MPKDGTDLAEKAAVVNQFPSSRQGPEEYRQNIGHSFISLMNHSRDDYSMGHILRFARETGLNTVTIDLMKCLHLGWKTALSRKGVSSCHQPSGDRSVSVRLRAFVVRIGRGLAVKASLGDRSESMAVS
jgi:hypothetical protein